jgi:Na+/H+ antiporter NhaD/arsenite permease-like protein
LIDPAGRKGIVALGVVGALALPALARAAEAAGPMPPTVYGVPIDFILFALTLLGVALFHHKTLQVALTGLVVISTYKILFSPFATGPGVGGFVGHLHAEWVVVANLFCLLMGFALLAKHFEDSEVPQVLPKFLPDDWKGGFALLVMVFVLSSFLDNIAAALIGGAVAHTVFRKKVHLGYIAGIVAASNAGGAGSVVGDTTTTMMWISHISPLAVLHAYGGAIVALVVCGIPASIQQHRYSPIMRDEPVDTKIDWARVFIVGLILVSAITINLIVNVEFPEHSESFPFIGVTVWLALLVTVGLRKPDWSLLPQSFRGSVFLLSLVVAATMMPVNELPAASPHTAFNLGIVSAFFDNIPLTALAIEQGHYDWGVLAYAVGFGGSMVWFGSSAGVAISNMFTEAKSVGKWVKNGWHVMVAYVIGFLVLMLLLGWHPTERGLATSGVSSLPAATVVAPG